MSLLHLAYVIALRRIISTWRLELVLFLGIVLAVALLSSGMVFSDMLAEAALRRALDQATPEEANLSVRVFNGLDDPSIVAKEDSIYRSSYNFVEGRVGGRFQSYLRDKSHLIETSTFFFQGHPNLELADSLRPRGRIMYMSGLAPGSQEPEARVEVLEGRWPYAASGGRSMADPGGPVPDGPVEVAIDTRGSQLLQLGVGDEMEVFPASGVTDPPAMRVRVVGIFQRADPDAEFWYRAERTLSIQDDQWTMVPLFTSDDAIYERVGRIYPGLYTDFGWFYYLDRHGLRAGDVDAIQATILGAKNDVSANLDNSSIFIKLDEVLDEYEEQLLLARIPLFLMVFLVTGILIYYLALVSGLIVRSRSTEISVLKSRGATTAQIGLLAAVEGVLLAVPAIALGPLLALGVSKALGRVFFDFQSGGDQAPVTLSSEAFLLGVAGAFLAVVVLTVSTLVSSRHGIVEFRQTGARPPRAPFVHRYYIDILALALIGVVWWQIQSRGSFLVRSVGTGELQIDFSLMLGPVLGLLALGLLVLRVFPLVVGIVAWAAERLGPAWLAQGSRRVSRDPIVPGALVVLLMLATALGVIGSAFSSTLERSQKDRALYAAGADLRVQHAGDTDPMLLLGLSDLAGPDGGVDGVERAAEVERISGGLLTKGLNFDNITVLAVDTENFAEVVGWYRPDFVDGKSLEELTSAIRPDPASFPSHKPSAEGVAQGEREGVLLPEDASALSIWVNPVRPDGRESLRARLQDARGYYFDILIGRLNLVGWQRFEADLSPMPTRISFGSEEPPKLPEVIPPFTLLSFQVYARGGAAQPGAAFLGDLVAITPRGEETIEDFQTLEGWHVVEDYARPGLYALELSESVATPTNGKAARFSWAPGGIGARALRVGRPEKPVPTVVSRSLLDIAEAQVGDTVTISVSNASFLIEVVGAAEYLPTLNPREKPFVVMDLRTFTHHTNLHKQTASGGSNELWARLDSPDRDPDAVVQAIAGRDINVKEAHLASEMVAQRVDQPLVNASWGGLLVLMFLALVLASASGVMLFSYMDTRERQTDFVLLRTLGFSKGQVNGVVWFTLLVVVVCGLGLGTWAGQQIGASLLPILEVAEEGVRVTPPMVLQTNWLTLLVSYLVLAAVTGGTVLWLAWLTARLEIQQVLRIGEA